MWAAHRLQARNSPVETSEGPDPDPEQNSSSQEAVDIRWRLENTHKCTRLLEKRSHIFYSRRWPVAATIKGAPYVGLAEKKMK